MSVVEEKLKDLRKRESKIREMGGAGAVAQQHERGKMTARERLNYFYDPGTFREIDMFVKHRGNLFGIDKVDIPADGVVTGFGNVNGRQVFAYAQDFTSRAGSLGEMHAKKICKVMDLSLRAGKPIVGFCDSGGARIQEGIDSLTGYGHIFYGNAIASGVVPQISAIMGPCAGGAVYSPAMTDFIFMVKGTGHMFITGPDVIRSVLGEVVTQEELGGAMAHNSKSGVAQFAAEDDADCIDQIKWLLSFFPDNNTEDPPCIEPTDSPKRLCPELDTVIPDAEKGAYDMRTVIRSIVDDADFFEVHRYFAQNVLVGFARLDGKPIGIIANQPTVLAGCLDTDASDKAARFIRTCDCFNIPMLAIADVPGYMPGRQQEWGGIIRHGAKLLWSYSEATVPKITLTTRKKYGGSYMAMCSSDLRSDFSYAWPTAEIAVMGADGAANIIFRREIKESADPAAKRQEMIDEYRTQFNNPYAAAARGYIDGVIMPSDTRACLIESFRIVSGKRQALPPKKHGNIPQ
jgi:methylmalonyl-CoA decarboxylase subunit alpha